MIKEVELLKEQINGLILNKVKLEEIKKDEKVKEKFVEFEKLGRELSQGQATNTNKALSNTRKEKSLIENEIATIEQQLTLSKEYGYIPAKNLVKIMLAALNKNKEEWEVQIIPSGYCYTRSSDYYDEDVPLGLIALVKKGYNTKMWIYRDDSGENIIPITIASNNSFKTVKSEDLEEYVNIIKRDTYYDGKKYDLYPVFTLIQENEELNAGFKMLPMFENEFYKLLEQSVLAIEQEKATQIQNKIKNHESDLKYYAKQILEIQDKITQKQTEIDQNKLELKEQQSKVDMINKEIKPNASDDLER